MYAPEIRCNGAETRIEVRATRGPTRCSTAAAPSSAADEGPGNSLSLMT
jgi:hypothetical protein